MFLAFVLFCVLFGRKGYHLTAATLKTFQQNAQKDVKEADFLLKEAGAFLKETKAKGKKLATQIEAIESCAQSQIDHMKHKAQQECAALMTQGAAAETAHVNALRQQLSRRLLAHGTKVLSDQTTTLLARKAEANQQSHSLLDTKQLQSLLHNRI